MENKVIFREVQHNRQIVPLVIVFGIAALTIYSFIQQIIIGEPFGQNPAPDWVMYVLLLLFGVGLPAMFLMMNLTIEVRTDGLYMKIPPFKPRWERISPSELSIYYARAYDALSEYGGWGIRYGFGGKAYNMSGDKGVQLKFTNGRSLLIGTKRPSELVDAINSIFTKAEEK